MISWNSKFVDLELAPWSNGMNFPMGSGNALHRSCLASPVIEAGAAATTACS